MPIITAKSNEEFDKELGEKKQNCFIIFYNDESPKACWENFRDIASNIANEWAYDLKIITVNLSSVTLTEGNYAKHIGNQSLPCWNTAGKDGTVGSASTSGDKLEIEEAINNLFLEQ